MMGSERYLFDCEWVCFSVVECRRRPSPLDRSIREVESVNDGFFVFYLPISRTVPLDDSTYFLRIWTSIQT